MTNSMYFASSVAAVFAVYSAGCNNDYAIYADVSGTVVDGAGAPVSGVTVTRSNAAKLREGESPITATTDASGRYRLTLHAVGSKPAPSELWVVQASLGTRTGTAEKSVPWSADRSVCLGYCTRDLTIVLRP